MKHFFTYSRLLLLISLLFMGCGKKPGSVIKDFYAAKTWDEKKVFVLDAEGLKQKDLYSEEATYEIKDITFLKKVSEISSVYKVTFNRTEAGKEEKRVNKFLIVKSGDVEKIDFKTMNGFNELSFEQFLDKRPTTPVKFWVKAEINTPMRSVYNIKAVEVNDGLGSMDFNVFCDGKNATPDESKIYDFATNHKRGMILIEVGSIIKFSIFYRLRDVKFLQESPIEED